MLNEESEREELRTFGPLVAGLLGNLRKGDMSAADQLWDVGQTLSEDKRKELEKLVHAELDKLDM